MGQGEEEAKVVLLSSLVIQPLAGVIPDLYFHIARDRGEQLEQQVLQPDSSGVTQHHYLHQITSSAQCGKNKQANKTLKPNQ